MELEELRDLFDKNVDRSNPGHERIDQGIFTTFKSPLKVYKQNTRFTLFAFPVGAVIILGTIVVHPATRHSATHWLLLLILFIEFMFSVINYRIVQKISLMDGAVRENIRKKIDLLHKNNNSYLLMHQLLYVLMAVVFEWSMLLHNEPNFSGWSGTNIIIRLTFYGVILTLIYFQKRYSQKRQYGQYLDKMRSLASQLDAGND